MSRESGTQPSRNPSLTRTLLPAKRRVKQNLPGRSAQGLGEKRQAVVCRHRSRKDPTASSGQHTLAIRTPGSGAPHGGALLLGARGLSIGGY